MTLPPYLAICGNPGSGKTTVEKLLIQEYGMMAGGDGDGLRLAAMPLFGLTRDDVWTQEGKARQTCIAGTEYENRFLLGELGKLLETKFGADFIPEMNLRSLTYHQRALVADGGSIVFASCRMNQARVYKQAGGICIGIVNEFASPSPYAFDQFNPALVDAWITNDGQDLDALRRSLATTLDHFIDRRGLAA